MATPAFLSFILPATLNHYLLCARRLLWSTGMQCYPCCGRNRPRFPKVHTQLTSRVISTSHSVNDEHWWFDLQGSKDVTYKLHCKNHDKLILRCENLKFASECCAFAPFLEFAKCLFVLWLIVAFNLLNDAPPTAVLFTATVTVEHCSKTGTA